jgi:CBS domain containing-hemolysin-like protein
MHIKHFALMQILSIDVPHALLLESGYPQTSMSKLLLALAATASIQISLGKLAPATCCAAYSLKPPQTPTFKPVA